MMTIEEINQRNDEIAKAHESARLELVKHVEECAACSEGMADHVLTCSGCAGRARQHVAISGPCEEYLRLTKVYDDAGEETARFMEEATATIAQMRGA